MYKTAYPAKTGHIIVQLVKGFIHKMRQNPDVYPIRYYKKSRRLRSNTSVPSVK